MYDFQFGKRGDKDARNYISPTCSLYSHIMPLVWGEHCVECAAPYCYKTCLRFVARPDAHCMRFEHGIEAVKYQNKIAARVRFKPWGKLGCSPCRYFLPAKEYERIYRISIFLGNLTALLARILPGEKLKFKATGLYYKLLRFCISQASEKLPVKNCANLQLGFLNNDKPSSILIDAKRKGGVMGLRKMLHLPLGESSFCIELTNFNEISWLDIHPANVEEELELTITEAVIVPGDTKDGNSCKKVKCVIWDMDNTLWDGVLIEQEEVAPRPEFVSLIKHLDEMGIVNSIASKNDESQVMEVLKRHHLAEYFVFPKINWNPKSANIAKTIKDMNINANTVVFVDDNPFEREEVKSLLPSITCIEPQAIEDMARGERFQVPVSPESAQRRQTYKMLEALKTEEELWSGNIDSFLKNCRISLSISWMSEKSIHRCYELLQRSNQLNASGRRLSMETLEKLMRSSKDHCYVLESSDKFGSYGIVGVAIVHHADTATLTDFVISCRVANKKIETTLINFLARKYNGVLYLNFHSTPLNGPMKKMLMDLEMRCISKKDKEDVYQHIYDANYPPIVTVIDQTESC